MLTPKQLRAQVEEKLVTARTSLYNPLLQQPVRLEPVGPGSYPSGLGGYSYLGPPPDFGGSYGAYEDTSGHRQIGVLASKHFSMHDGSPMALRSELSKEEREALLSQLDEAHEGHKCEHCRSELTISIAQPVEISALHCPYCGSSMSGAIDKAKACWAKLKENEEMATPVETKAPETQAAAPAPAAVAAAPAPAAPVAAAADIAKEAAAMPPSQQEMGTQVKDVAKDAQKAETPAQQHPHENPDKAKPMEHSDKGTTQVKPVEELAKGLTKASADEVKAQAETDRLAKIKAASDAWAKNRQARVQAMRERHAKKIEASKEARKEFLATAKMRRDLRVMATQNPEQFAEVKKNETMAPICAEVEKKLLSKAERKQVRAELMALAKDNPEAAEQAKKELDFIAPEILMEQDEMPAAEAPKPEDEVKPADAAAKAKAEEACPPAAPAEAAEAMKTEFLASIHDLPGHRVEMSLYGEEGDNPFWNLTVDAEPVARIFLADQENASQIRASFVSDAYAQNFGDLIGKAGLPKMLELSKAKVFAHRADDTETALRIREKVKADMQKEFDAKVETLQGDFLRAVELAMVASNKNLYEDEGANVLKGELFNHMLAANMTEEFAVQTIEASFKSAPAYFKHLTDKAREIMSQPAEARESIEKWITGAGVKQIEVQATEVDKDKELLAKLIEGSAAAMTMNGVVGGENRNQIRAHLGLGRSSKGR